MRTTAPILATGKETDFDPTCFKKNIEDHKDGKSTAPNFVLWNGLRETSSQAQDATSRLTFIYEARLKIA